jgi:hypothetical protein
LLETTAGRAVYPADPNRPNRFRTDEGCHTPPRAVTMPRLFNFFAIAGREVAPVARMSAMIGDRSAAHSSASA